MKKTMRSGLTLPAVLERAEACFPTKEIVSITPAGVFRYTFRQYGQRVRKLASALVALGVQKGDRVATLAWNQHQHLETYFAVPSIGAVLQTLNPRLPQADLTRLINHAAAKVILADAEIFPLLESVASELKTVEHYIMMGDGTKVQPRLRHVTSYETLIAPAEAIRQWPDMDECDPAGMGYSSAEGSPTTVKYAHRALWLHSLAFCHADPVGVSEQDTILIVVPLFHPDAWGLPFAALWTGAKVVLPGPHPDMKLFCEVIQRERVTLAAGVPPVWIDVLALLEREPYGMSDAGRVLCDVVPFEKVHRAAGGVRGMRQPVTELAANRSLVAHPGDRVMGEERAWRGLGIMDILNNTGILRMILGL